VLVLVFVVMLVRAAAMIVGRAHAVGSFNIPRATSTPVCGFLDIAMRGRTVAE
jgi:hypothetical protein